MAGNDRLRPAQGDVGLPRRGVSAPEHRGCTQSDGYEDVRAAWEDATRKSGIIGHCFDHGQDLERAVEGGGLYLTLSVL